MKMSAVVWGGSVLLLALVVIVYSPWSVDMPVQHTPLYYTEVMLNTVKDSCEYYKKDNNGCIPGKGDEIFSLLVSENYLPVMFSDTVDGVMVVLDGWGRPLKIKTDDKTVTIYSVGADGIDESSDDVTRNVRRS